MSRASGSSLFTQSTAHLQSSCNMRFTTALSTLIPFILTAAAAGPTPLDVFVPPITFPTAGTVWVSKTQQTLTWYVPLPPNITRFVEWCDRDASGAPPNISNEALLLLRLGNNTAPCKDLPWCYSLLYDLDLPTCSHSGQGLRPTCREPRDYRAVGTVGHELPACLWVPNHPNRPRTTY